MRWIPKQRQMSKTLKRKFAMLRSWFALRHEMKKIVNYALCIKTQGRLPWERVVKIPKIGPLPRLVPNIKPLVAFGTWRLRMSMFLRRN